MKNVLRLSTSLFAENSVSSSLSEDLLSAFRAKGNSFSTVHRDFGDEAIPHLDGEWLTALSTPEGERSEEQRNKVAFSDLLIAEVKAADTLVISLPMYNFTVPSMLKAWVDHIARAGVTFAYTAAGPKGLLQNKKVYLVASMGGIHDTSATDFLRPYMKLIMGFIGLDDIEVITASGLNMGEEARAKGIANAKSEIAALEL
ncbi:MAG: FMN-dependent NADH-azoreductase [Pseudohongiellaceae bacterium]